MEVITIDGQQFVKASAAARQAGYTPDYVGQLARAGAIPARLIGRTWYVDADVLRTHRVEKKRFAREKAREQVKKAIAEKNNPEAVSAALGASRSASVRLSVYDKDEHDLMPVIEKTSTVPGVEAVVVSKSEQDPKGDYTPITVTVLPSEAGNSERTLRTAPAIQPKHILTPHRQVIAPRKKQQIAPDMVSRSAAVTPATPVVAIDKKRKPQVEDKTAVAVSEERKRRPWLGLVLFALAIPVALILATIEVHTIQFNEGEQKGSMTEYVINIGALRNALMD